MQVSPFIDILCSNYLDVCQIDEGNFIYVCGYLTQVLVRQINCVLCISFVRDEKGGNIDNQYFDYLQKGRLSVPSNKVVSLMFSLGAY